MKPKQKSVTKTHKNLSAPMKSLLKWITTTNSSTGGVTYTQVKNFLDSKQEGALKSCNAKLLLTNLLDKGHLVKVGYKYVMQVQTTPQKNQVKKASGLGKTIKKSIANLSKTPQKALKSVPVSKVKRSPGNLDIRVNTNAEGRTVEKNIKKSFADLSKTPQTVFKSVPVSKVKRSPGNLDIREKMRALKADMQETFRIPKSPRNNLKSVSVIAEMELSSGILEIRGCTSAESMDVANDTTVTAEYKAEDSAVSIAKVKRSSGIIDICDCTRAENSTTEGTKDGCEIPSESMDVANDTAVTEDQAVNSEGSAETEEK